MEAGHPHLSIARQCELLGLSRSGYYYQPTGESELNLLLMRRLDKEYTEHPFFGYRKMVHVLHEAGHIVNKKRIARLMHRMGLQAQVPGPNTSRPHPQNPVYPYRLRGIKIEVVNQVWSCDITYIPMPKGFVYLFAIIDWYSRMDGHGRALDNIFVERLWRTVKYKNVYPKGYETPKDVYSGLRDYFQFYNEARPHQALAYKTPAAVYYQSLGC